MNIRLFAVSFSKALLSLSIPVLIVGGAHAQWTFTTVEMPDSFAWSTSYATAAKDHYGIGVGPGGPGSATYTASRAQTSANAPQGPAHASGSGSAFEKSKTTFVWSGGGAPVARDVYSSKDWSVTPIPNTNNVSNYATASFNGTQVTVASGSTPWVVGVPLTVSNTDVTYSAGSTSSDGYITGSYVGRSSTARYLWDTTGMSGY